MKKRLIIILLALCLVVGMFSGTIPFTATACEENCGQPGLLPYDEEIGCNATITERVCVKSNLDSQNPEDPYLKKGDVVWVIGLWEEKDEGKFYYLVQIKKLEVYGYIPVSSAELHQNYELPYIQEDCWAGFDPEEEEIDWVQVKKAGKITKDGGAIVRIDIYNPDAEKDPMLDENSDVWVKRIGFYEGEYWYHISMGYYGEMYVRTKFVTLDGEEKPAEAEPQKPGTAKSESKKDKGQKQEGSEENAVTEKVEQVEKQGKVSPLDRYLFFTSHGGVMCRAWNLNQSAFQQLHLF